MIKDNLKRESNSNSNLHNYKRTRAPFLSEESSISPNEGTQKNNKIKTQFIRKEDLNNCEINSKYPIQRVQNSSIPQVNQMRVAQNNFFTNLEQNSHQYDNLNFGNNTNNSRFYILEQNPSPAYNNLIFIQNPPISNYFLIPIISINYLVLNSPIQNNFSSLNSLYASNLLSFKDQNNNNNQSFFIKVDNNNSYHSFNLT